MASTNIPRDTGKPAKPGELPNVPSNPEPATGPSEAPKGGNPSDPNSPRPPR